MTGSALALRNIDDIQRVSKAYALSGYWPDSRDVAQAFVKVSFGVEVGLPAYVAMSEVHIIQGKPTLGAGALAGLVKGHPNYDYRVLDHTDEVCEIEFYQGPESLGVSRFTMDDARTAGLTSNPTWKKYPRNMLFARAISNGVAWYCPDVTMGRVYTPDELAPPEDAPPAGVDAETGEIIVDAETVEVMEMPAASDPTAPEPEVADEPADVALWQQADRLTEQLVALALEAGADPAVAGAHAQRNRAGHRDEPEAHVAWLEQQLEKVRSLKTESGFQAPASARGEMADHRRIVIRARELGLSDEQRKAATASVVGGTGSSKAVPRDQVDAVLAALEQAALRGEAA